MIYNNVVKFGITPNFDQNQLLNAILQFATGSNYSSSYSNFTTGQIFFDVSGNVPCYIDNIGAVRPMAGSWSMIFGDTILTNQPLLLGDGSSLQAMGTAIISANRFNGNAIISVSDGGTANSGFRNNAVLLGNNTDAIKASGLFYNQASGSLSIGNEYALASITVSGNLGQAKPVFMLEKRSLLTIPAAHTFEYDGSGYYYTADWGTRYQFATRSDNLADVFTGILPINRGGTNNNSFSNGAIVLASGDTLVSLVGAFSGAVPEWNGNKWISSVTGYITQSPSSTNRNTITTSLANIVPLTLRAASTTGIALQIQNSGQIHTASIDVSGNIFYDGILYPFRRGAASQPYISIKTRPNVSGAYIRMEAEGNYHAGTIDTSAYGDGVTSWGGHIHTHGGANGAGGYIETSDGGGAIDTRGSGFIQLGRSTTFNRTSIIGGASGSNKTIRLPNQNGTIPVVASPFVSGYLVGHNGSSFVMVSGGGGGVTSHSALTGLSLDDHTQYIINLPQSSGRNYIYASGSVPGLTIQAQTPSISGHLFGVRSSGGIELFKVTNSGAIANNNFTIYNGSGNLNITSAATGNISVRIPNSSGYLLVSNNLPSTSGYNAYYDPSTIGNVRFAAPYDVALLRRRFGVYTNQGVANTRTIFGLAAFTVSPPATLANDSTGPWQRQTINAGDAGTMETTSIYYLNWRPDVTIKWRMGTNVTSGYWGFGFGEGGAFLSDPSMAQGAIAFVYDTDIHSGATWRVMHNASSATNATTTNTSIPVVTGGIYTFRIQYLSPNETNYYYNNQLIYTATGNLPDTSMQIAIATIMINAATTTRAYDFNWLQGDMD